MNELAICICDNGHSTDHTMRTEHYESNFIPTGWELAYTSLDRRDANCALYLTGWCLRCGGKNLRIGENIPNDTSDAFLERVYQQMGQFRPYDHRFKDGTYRTELSMRAQWYMEQDDLTLGARNAQFLKLFHPDDRGIVEEWLNRCHAEELYVEPRRDRKSTLLRAVLERARANGDLKEIEPILDYYLPNKNEPLSPGEDSYLTNYGFSARPTMSFGCEGIYVELYIEGEFDDSGKTHCSIGTFKTLRDDAEASRLMGQLCGVLMYHTAAYVNENLHRYTSKRELEAELRRKVSQQEGRGEANGHA